MGSWAQPVAHTLVFTACGLPHKTASFFRKSYRPFVRYRSSSTGSAVSCFFDVVCSLQLSDGQHGEDRDQDHPNRAVQEHHPRFCRRQSMNFGEARQWCCLAVVACVLACGASAQTTPTATEELAFTSRGARLIGTLHLPPGPGPHPLIVGVHGSGRVDRSDLYQGEAARYFTPRGVAFFMFDKRGVGKSGGTYPGSYSSSMVTYAVDVLAAVEHLAARADIDASRIGLWGISQAGWIIPIAASMAQERIAFTIIVSGPTVSIAEENLYSDLTGDSYGRSSGLSREEIARRMATAEPKGLDASAFIAELRMPGLWIYGDLDQSVPWEQGIADLRSIADEWDRDFTWKVFRGANHGMRKARTGGSWERPRPSQPVDGYFEYQAEWLRTKLGIAVGGGA